MSKQIRIPIPKNITENHPDFVYWSGLSDILSKALTYKKITLDEIKQYYTTFATLDEPKKRKYLVAVNDQLQKILNTIEAAIESQNLSNLEEKIVWMVNKFPSSMHNEVYEFLISGEPPYKEFFADLELAIKYQNEDGQVDFEDVSPYSAIEELKDYSLRLDNSNIRNKTQNSKPISQNQLNQLLQSTSRIRENLDDTPEYGYNELTNKTEIKNNPAKMAKRNLSVSNLIKNANSDKLIKIPSISKPAKSVTDSILKNISLVGNNTDDNLKTKQFSQDQINNLKNIKKL